MLLITGFTLLKGGGGASVNLKSSPPFIFMKRKKRLKEKAWGVSERERT